MIPKPGNLVTEAPTTLAGWEACTFVAKLGWDAFGKVLARCEPSIITKLDITKLD